LSLNVNTQMTITSAMISIFYIRCVLPPAVHDTGRDYCVGVWAQVSLNGFNRLWDLWDDENQSKEPLLLGILAKC